MSAAAMHNRGILQSRFYHLNTLYLFTGDQLLDTVYPSTVFGTLAAISGQVLTLPSQRMLAVMQQLPVVWSWLWLIILQLCLHNQRHTDSIEEDAIKKPWRPLPSKRITEAQVKNVLAGTYIVTALVSWHLGVVTIFVA
jgi:4-hydroxybenzoate polyprenyltransferase